MVFWVFTCNVRVPMFQRNGLHVHPPDPNSVTLKTENIFLWNIRTKTLHYMMLRPKRTYLTSDMKTWILVSKCVDCYISCRFSKFICSFRVQYYEPGSEHQVIVPGEPVGKLISAILQWEYRTNPLNPLTWRFFLTPHIYIDWMEIESIEDRHRYIMFGEVFKQY